MTTIACFNYEMERNDVKDAVSAMSSGGEVRIMGLKKLGVIFLLLSFMLSFACATSENGGFMTAEEAKKLSVDFETMRVPPPPRDSSDIREILSDIRSRISKETPKSEQAYPDPKEIDEMYSSAFVIGGIYAVCRDKSLDASMAGQHMRARAITKRCYELLKDSGSSTPRQISHIGTRMAQKLIGTGSFSEAMHYLDEVLPETASPTIWADLRYTQIQSLRAYIFALVGDLTKAKSALELAEASLTYHTKKPDWTYLVFGTFELAKAQLLFGQGKDNDAKNSIQTAMQYFEMSIYARPYVPACGKMYVDILIRNGKLIEAELYARQALKKASVNYSHASVTIPLILGSLTTLYSEMGRASEAEEIARVALEIREHGSMQVKSGVNLAIGIDLMNALILQEKWDEAVEIADNILKLGNPGDPLFSQLLRTSWYAYIFAVNASVAYIKSGRFHEFAEYFESTQSQAVKMFGENHYAVAELKALRGVSYLEQGELKKAHEAFASAIPVLLKAQGISESQGNLFSRKMRLAIIAEAYLRLLSSSNNTAFKRQAEKDILTNGFRLAESAKTSMVTAAIRRSSARAAALDPNLKGLIRKEQDFQKQIASLTVGLSRQMGQTGNLRDEKVIVALGTRIDSLRQKRGEIKEEIKKNFPEYQKLIRQSFPGVDEVKPLLRPGEALISMFVGEDRSYVWAIPKEQPAQFAAVDIRREEIEQTVKSLRSALAPEGVKTLGEIPQFDVAAAYHLYQKLLKPVKEGWKGANNLIVVQHGAMGYLPLSLLVTEPFGAKPEKAPIFVYGGQDRSDASAVRKDHRGLFTTTDTEPFGAKTDERPLFSGYRDVPWLARTHAITTLPSVASLKALRTAKDYNPAQRPFVGFGDPFFKEEHAEEEAKKTAAARNVNKNNYRNLLVNLRNHPQTRSLHSATIEALPRLRETRDEITSIAETLGADPNRDLFFGRAANEHNAKTADLDKYRIVSFATHGLMAGDLDGLTQPALALTSPKVAKIDGDGLLTMGEVLGLKLNSDWVLLSACNTGAGEGAGAEAVSGLGRAFFYAGAKALLVSNWPVNSKATTDLMTTLFREQKEDPSLTRAEALRKAEMALIDGPGLVDSKGRTLYSYAHPIFWAPFVVVGEGE